MEKNFINHSTYIESRTSPVSQSSLNLRQLLSSSNIFSTWIITVLFCYGWNGTETKGKSPYHFRSLKKSYAKFIWNWFFCHGLYSRQDRFRTPSLELKCLGTSFGDAKQNFQSLGTQHSLRTQTYFPRKYVCVRRLDSTWPPHD